MAQITITAPNPEFNGVSAGVRFSEGKAVIESTQLAALEYFARHRFGISEEVKSEVDDLLTVKAAPAPIDPLDVEAVAKLTGDQIDALALEHGVDVGSGKKAEKAAALAAGIRAKIAHPESVASGPVGPQHNQGQDGANPDGGTPQTTPIDAGI